MMSWRGTLAGVAVLSLWAACLYGISRYSQTASARIEVRLASPGVDEPVLRGRDGYATLRWDLRGVDRCEASLGAGSMQTRGVRLDPRGEARLPIDADSGQRSVLVSLRCDGRLLGRYLRRIEQDATQTTTSDERVEVARLHVDEAVLRTVFADQVPSVLNPILNQELARAGRAIAEESRSWPVPGWLVDGVRLERSSRVAVQRARLQLGEGRFSIALDVDVRLDVVILNRPIIAPSRRGTREIPLSIRDAFRPVMATFSLEEWPRIRVKGVRLRGQYCQRFERDRVRTICDRVVERVYSALEDVVADQLSAMSADLFRSLDVRAVLVGSLRDWASSLALEQMVNALIADADFALTRTSQDAAGLHASVDVSREWLSAEGLVVQRAVSSMLELDDTEATIDLAVRLGVVNRVLHELFARPLEELVSMLEPSSTRYGTGTGLRAVEEFLETGADADLSEADRRILTLLRLASMRLSRDAQLDPWLWVNESDRVQLDTGTAALLTSVTGHAAVWIGAIVPMQIREEASVYTLSLDGAEGLESVALEAAGMPGDDAGSMLERRRAAAAVGLFYRALEEQRAPDRRGATTSDGARFPVLEQLLDESTTIPLFSRRISVGSWEMLTNQIRFRHTNQALELSTTLQHSPR